MLESALETGEAHGNHGRTQYLQRSPVHRALSDPSHCDPLAEPSDSIGYRVLPALSGSLTIMASSRIEYQMKVMR